MGLVSTLGNLERNLFGWPPRGRQKWWVQTPCPQTSLFSGGSAGHSSKTRTEYFDLWPSEKEREYFFPLCPEKMDYRWANIYAHIYIYADYR